MENNDNGAVAVAGAGAGAVGGGVLTSGAAMAATGTGGITGYTLGVGSLIAHVGCEAAAVVGLGTVAAGPIIGGLVGYGIYRGVKSAVRG